MPDSAALPASSVPPARSRTGVAWMLALVAALALVAWDAARNIRHYTRASTTYGVAVHAPAQDAASPTGYADGRRALVLPSLAVDGQHWIMQTQQMLATGEWRLHRVEDDNAPEGRSVHWGSPFRWWLGLCAWIDHLLSGRPLGLAAEHAALFANPALLALALLAFVPWVARRLGGAAGGFLAFAMVGTPAFTTSFAANNPDHHGLIQLCTMACVLALLASGAGWVRGDDTRTLQTGAWLPHAAYARRAFTLSAIAGGLGLWVSAAGTIPVLIGIGLGALAAAWFGRKAADGVRFDATLWRRWGAIGGATTFAAYLVEYFPALPGWRLEVIHPLYALAWWGAGEVLAAVTTALSQGRLAPARSARVRLAAGFAALAAPAVVIVGGGTRVFVVADPFLWSLSHDYVPEGQGLLTAIGRAGLTLNTAAVCLPMLTIVLVAGWLAHRTTPALARAAVAIPLAVAGLFWAMGFKELRWWTIGHGFLFGLLVIVASIIAMIEHRRARRAWWWAIGVALFAPGLVETVRTTPRSGALAAEDFLSLTERDLAHALRQRTGSESLVVLSAPAATSRLIYYGGARGLGTAYWENLDGLKRAAAIFAARTPDEAHALVRAADVTHIVLSSWDDFVDSYVRLARGLSAREPITERAFGLDLLRSPVPPPWLRPVPSHVPDHPALHGQHVLIYEVTDRTRPEQALVRDVNHLLYQDQIAAAVALRQVLQRFPENLAAQIALARVLGGSGDSAGSAAALARAKNLLDQAPALEPEDRIHLITALALSGDVAGARAQLTAAWPALDAAALRRLTPGSLMNLVALAGRLEVAWPDARLQQLATELVPPDGRR